MKRRVALSLVLAALLIACTADLRELGGSNHEPFTPYPSGTSGSSGAPVDVVTTRFRPYCVVTESSFAFSDPNIAFKPTSCTVAPRKSESEPQVIVFRQDPDELPDPPTDNSTQVVPISLLALVLPTGGASDKSVAFTPWPSATSLHLYEDGLSSSLDGAPPSGATFCFEPRGAWALQLGLTLGCSSRAARDSSQALLGTDGSLSATAQPGQEPRITTKADKYLPMPDGTTLLISTFEFEGVYRDQSSLSLQTGKLRGKVKTRAGTYRTTRDPKCRVEVPVTPEAGGAACLASFDDCSAKPDPDTFCESRCHGKICQGTNCCTSGGSHCANDADCCRGLACVKGLCVTQPSVMAGSVGAACASDTQRDSGSDDARPGKACDGTYELTCGPYDSVCTPCQSDLNSAETLVIEITDGAARSGDSVLTLDETSCTVTFPGRTDSYDKCGTYKDWRINLKTLAAPNQEWHCNSGGVCACQGTAGCTLKRK